MKDYELSYFNEVVTWSPFHITLASDTVCRMTIVASQEVLDDFQLEIEDSVLSLKDGRGIKWDTPKSNAIEITIFSPDLKRLETKQSSVINNVDSIKVSEFGLVLGAKANEVNLSVNCETFYYWSGAVTGGKLTLGGNCQVLKIWNAGLMTVDAAALNTLDAIVENRSRGDVEVRVSRKLDYLVDGHGDVYLRGDPEAINQLQEDGSSGTLLEQN